HPVSAWPKRPGLWMNRCNTFFIFPTRPCTRPSGADETGCACTVNPLPAARDPAERSGGAVRCAGPLFLSAGSRDQAGMNGFSSVYKKKTVDYDGEKFLPPG